MIAPAGFEKALGSLMAALRGENIPFNGWSFRAPAQGEPTHFTTDKGEPIFIELIHSSETSTEQRETLNQIVAGFEFEERTKKPRTDLRSALRSLSDADFKDLLIELLAEKLEQDSEFARRIGKTVDGDETKRKLGGK